MRKQTLNELIEFDNLKYRRQVLIDEPGYCLAILSIPAGLSIPEHATPGNVTVCAMQGHIVFHDGPVYFQLHAGEMVSIAASILYRLEAYVDSALLVLHTVQDDASHDRSEESDAREVPHSHRQPLGFRRLDSLATADIVRPFNHQDSEPSSRQIDTIRPGQALCECT
ncbi:MAG: hypothetical protein WA869_06195 [Alloacidobacterium sp.]